MAKIRADTAAAVRRELAGLADKRKAVIFSRFFKAGKGDYGEGDKFYGISVPQVRAVVARHLGLPHAEVAKLLADPMHECRLTAVIILVEQYERAASPAEETAIAQFYLSHLDGVNNWDLVDASAYCLLGEYLAERPRGVLYELAASGHLWRERVAVVSTLAFIRRGDFADIFKLSEQFLSHRHDLIHKACGWMLREAGKRDAAALKAFLRDHGDNMPRTMLRYAIERFTPEERAGFLAMGKGKKRS
ncbi:MAG TPA: DNA alkylation repair protein [Candidatus Peribacteria bacterium]|nr:DNA alkylation repair protein [Candidatus Peribacteria bacterium]